MARRGARGGSAWESNPPSHAERGATGFEDRGTHRDPSAPVVDGSAVPSGRLKFAEHLGEQGTFMSDRVGVARADCCAERLATQVVEPTGQTSAGQGRVARLLP
jgi:hypothetical protein